MLSKLSAHSLNLHRRPFIDILSIIADNTNICTADVVISSSHIYNFIKISLEYIYWQVL